MAVMTVLLFKTVKNHATYVLMVSKTTGSLLLILSIKLHRLLKIKSLMFFNYKIVVWNHAVIGCLLLFVNPFAMLQCVIVVPLVNVAKPASNANGKYSCIYYIKDECITMILQTDRKTLLKTYSFQMFTSRRIYWTMNDLI